MLFSILNYGSSNLKSVQQSLINQNVTCKITNNSQEILDSNCLIIPGVGSFSSAMKSIRQSNVENTISKFIKSGRLVVGICLGMQLLFESSVEFGDTSGLAVLKGKVSSLEKINLNNNFKIPNIGWHKINYKKVLDDNFSEFDNQYMYFVHSFFVEPEEDISLFVTKLGNNIFSSSVYKDNILGFQFHPEKSGIIGQNIYKKIFKLARSL